MYVGRVPELREGGGTPPWRRQKMAIDPKKWTIKTQEAFAAAIDDAKERSNPELTPDHLLSAMMRASVSCSDLMSS